MRWRGDPRWELSIIYIKCQTLGISVFGDKKTNSSDIWSFARPLCINCIDPPSPLTFLETV